MRKPILLLSFIFLSAMILGGCFDPMNSPSWSDGANSDSLWSSESASYDPDDDGWTDEELDAWLDEEESGMDEDLAAWLDEEETDEWTEEDLEAWLDEQEADEVIQSFEEDDYVAPPQDAQNGEFPAEHDPECAEQFHGSHFCGSYAEISYIEVDAYNADVEIQLDLYYHCYYTLVVTDIYGDVVAVLATQEEYTGDPAYAAFLPGEVPPHIPFDPDTDIADAYEHGPQPDTVYYRWNGLHGQTGEPVLTDVYYTAYLDIYFSEDGAIGLPTARDSYQFLYETLADMVEN